MEILSAEQIRRLDFETIHSDGIPSLKLMERAGLEFFKIFSRHIKEKQSILIIAGPGNNGGDAFVVARHLAKKKISFDLLLVRSPDQLKGDAFKTFQSLKPFLKYITIHHWQADAKKGRRPLRGRLHLAWPVEGALPAPLIIDGLSGTGIENNPRGIIKNLINWINKQKADVWSIDIPSGFNANTGKPLNPCVKATYTISFEYPKKGFFNPYYKDFIGGLFIVEIGLNRERIKKYGIRDFVSSIQTVNILNKPRVRNAHKGTFQMVSVIGGSKGKMGAPLLSGMGAYRGGAGLVQVIMPDSALKKINQDQLELMYEPIDDEACGYFKKKNVARVLQILNEKKGICVIGPGLGQNLETFEFVYEIIRKYEGPLIIDADALNALSKNKKVLPIAKSPYIVLTPHPKEMERLSGIPYEKVKKNREDFLRGFCQKNKMRVLLKGSFSLYSNPEGLIWVNPTGNPSQANGGQGDFLAGLIAGVIAERGAYDSSVLAAIFWHGLMADYLVNKQNRRITLASDLYRIADKALHWGLNNKDLLFNTFFK